MKNSSAPRKIAYGRTAFIDQLWLTLEGPQGETGRSIYINDLRRIGKTRILDHIQDDPRPGFHVMKRDVEGLDSADAFAQEVYRDTLKFLNGLDRAIGWTKKQWESLGGVGVWHFKIPEYRHHPCERLLKETFSHLNERMAKQGETLVCIWDELPALLDNIIMRQGNDLAAGRHEAGQLLDILRSIREDYSHIRMIFTGSIGMHHILKKLKKHGYKNRPLNNMEHMEPGPLTPKEGEALALRFLSDRKGMSGKPLENCARTVSEGTGHIPYYMEGLVSAIPAGQDPSLITPEYIKGILTDRLADSDWDLKYFEERIPNLYGEDKAPAVYRILNYLAESSVSVTEKNIHDKLNRLMDGGVEASTVHELMDLLVNDHYASKSGDPVVYVFRSPMIRRWWCMDHGLTYPFNGQIS